MGLKLETMCVVLDSDNSEELSAFYEKLLGWRRYGHFPDDEWVVVNNGKRDGLPELIFQQIDNYVRPVWPDESGKQSQMIHLDFHVDDLDEGVQYALSCGATLSPVQLEDSWRVMLDPAGHPFCILPKRYPQGI
jgi:catechol 2,3-dioxygenase-like lactoylglutathione lyase family enzyme